MGGEGFMCCMCRFLFFFLSSFNIRFSSSLFTFRSFIWLRIPLSPPSFFICFLSRVFIHILGFVPPALPVLF
ncbi:hypothetical protein BDQ17DRAFT_1355672 [Cyathus striatus]|nr:hypothetical protein BDQ17DRAFT_1355672 [Cyathus striatus]